MFAWKNEKGLTVIETIIALFLVGILVAAFSNALVTVLRSEVEIDKRLKASSLASGIIEYLGEGNNFDQISDKEVVYIDESYDLKYDDNNILNISSLEDLFFDDVNLSEDINEDKNIISSITIDEDFEGMDNLYEITVNIFWQERGNTRKYELTTVFDGGLQ